MKDVKRVYRVIRSNKHIEIFAYLVQNFFRINSQGGGSFGKSAEEMHRYFTSVADTYVSQLGADAFTQKVVLELGTGFSRSGMLYLIKKYDIKQVFCYDKFNCLSPVEDEIIKHNDLESYMNRLIYLNGEYEELLDHVDIDSVDTIVSNAVLEFVADLDALVKILGVVAKVGSVSFHRVDLKCHNKFKARGELYFHTFSDRFWRLMGGRIGQLSRRLADDYVEIFGKHSFSGEANKSFFSEKCLTDAEVYLEVGDYRRYSVSDLDLKLKKLSASI